MLLLIYIYIYIYIYNYDVAPSSLTAMTRCLILCVGRSHLTLWSPGGVVTQATDIISIIIVKLVDGTISSTCRYQVGIPLVKNAYYDVVLMYMCCSLDYNMCY